MCRGSTERVLNVQAEFGDLCYRSKKRTCSLAGRNEKGQWFLDQDWSNPVHTMAYKGYTARIDFDDDDGIFFGKIAGIRDGVSFHADTVKGLRAAFREAVDDYLDICAKLGKRPEKSIPGHRGAGVHFGSDWETSSCR
jgi:hypothetical protein